MDILMVYGTKEGQTTAINERIAQIIRSQGHQVTTRSVKVIPAGFTTDNPE